MSAKAVREFHGKKLLAKFLREEGGHDVEDRAALIINTTNYAELEQAEPWLVSGEVKLVVKPDQLIKRRGKAGLVGVNLTFEEVKKWIADRMEKEIKVEHATGQLDHFIVEPFVKHDQEDEYYVCIQSEREGEEILFCNEGGVDVGDVDAKAQKTNVKINDSVSAQDLMDRNLFRRVPEARVAKVASFVETMLKVYRRLNFTYMEINPIVVVGDRVTPLDLAAKIDETAAFLNASDWGYLEFPAPFGRKEFPEEAHIRELDSKTGASLKLTILNQAGRVWTMVAGGGASVVYADTISDLGFGHELANYGEYSGAPSTEHTFEYAKTLIGLMTKIRDPRGKILIIGGGIANFTDVAATFTGLIKALEMYQDDLKSNNVSIWVRRAGPNYQEGLKLMRETALTTGLPIRIYGPETHITAVVPLALGLSKLSEYPEFDDDEGHKLKKERRNKALGRTASMIFREEQSKVPFAAQDPAPEDHAVENFSASTRCVVYGLQNRAVQGMLDFDFMCKREKPSVAAMIFPFSSNHYIKFYWGTNEILMPVYQQMKECYEKHPDASVVVNFASMRSVYTSVTEILEFSKQIKTIAIIAEGVPESQTRALNMKANEKGVGIIGPATVGGIKVHFCHSITFIINSFSHLDHL